MAKKKKRPFQDARGKWYAILGKKKPRPYSERALKKALKAIKRAQRHEQERKREDKTALDFQQQLNEARREAGKDGPPSS